MMDDESWRRFFENPAEVPVTEAVLEGIPASCGHDMALFMSRCIADGEVDLLRLAAEKVSLPGNRAASCVLSNVAAFSDRFPT